MKNIEIIGCGMAKAGKVVSNDDLSKIVETNDEWISTRTGIRNRRFCTEDEDAYTLAFDAADNAIEDAGIDKADIGCLICATISGEYITPSMACVIQKRLGLREDIPVLDVNAACSGFIYAIEVARGLLNGNGEKYGLVIGCEQLSKLLDMTDRSTCVLFGDGAGAAIVKLTEDGLYESFLGARGGYEITVEGAGPVRSKISMEGQEVFKFAAFAIPKCVNALFEKSKLTIEDVDQIVCHQANERIIDHCVRKMKADPSKFYKNMDKYGNTSAASVPMALCELKQMGKVQAGSKVMLVGFGGGLTWAGVLLRLGDRS
ncbi:MAG: ketoacyl-ACP synthase III [Butyrivibrio sp.]|nr:ketoacyl-ACP synthase III [Butyrivibrio sp.]